MATQLFLLDTVADTHLGTNNVNLIPTAVGWTSKALGTARGSGVVASTATATVTGTTLGVVVQVGGVAAEWISPPVSADVTISGTITCNIWAAESDMNANVAINAVVDVIRANATATANSNTLVQIAKTARVTECAVTTRGVNNFTVTPTSTAVARGDRIRIRLFGDDVGTMATAFTFNASYNGTTAAADGDTYLTFTENFSFESAPGGTVLYLTNTHSGLTAAPALISSFTGSDENPLSEGGNWSSLNSSSQPLQRISSAASSSLGLGASYWTPANFGPDLEAYITLATSSAVSPAVALVVRVQGEGGAATWDGYRVDIAGSSTSTTIRRVTNAANTTLASGSAASSWASGDKLGLRIQGTSIEAWRQASGSSDWQLVTSAVDATYASAGKIGLMVGDTTVRVDDFYAATDSNLFIRKAWTSRGAGVVNDVTNTAAGWTAPIQVTKTADGVPSEWYTPQLQAFTLTGMAVANIRALESNAAANASLRCQVARVNSDGTSATVWADWAIAPTTTDNGELTTSEVARTCNVSGDDLAFTDGQRIRVRLYAEDISSAAMAASQTVTVYYAGTSAAASGDTYITLPQSVSEYVAATAGSAMQARRQRRASRYLTHR